MLVVTYKNDFPLIIFVIIQNILVNFGKKKDIHFGYFAITFIYLGLKYLPILLIIN